MRTPLALVLLAVLLAGCAGEETPYSVTGSFTGDRADEDIEELRELGEDLGGEVVILESFPEQFQVRALSLEDCETFREQVEGKDYVEEVGPCTEAEAGADPY